MDKVCLHFQLFKDKNAFSCEISQFFFNNKCFCSKCTSVKTEKCSIRLHLRNLKYSEIFKREREAHPLSQDGILKVQHPIDFSFEKPFYLRQLCGLCLHSWIGNCIATLHSKSILLQYLLCYVQTFQLLRMKIYQNIFLEVPMMQIWRRAKDVCVETFDIRMVFYAFLQILSFFYLSLFLNEFSRFGKHIDICPVFEVLFLT